MIKVLIVDDEPKLREGLKVILPWEELGFQIVGTAANGNEALALHQQHHPDLMCVDIRMPGMSGLDLIETIRAEDPEIHLLILSGYADFDYAKRAISQRVDGYLLKPVDEQELKTYILQIKEKIKQEQVQAAVNRADAEGNREAFLQSLIAEEAPLDSERLQRARRLELLWSRYQVMLIHIHEPGDAPTDEPELLFKRTLTEIFEETERGFVFTIHSYLGVLLPVPVQSISGRQELYHELEYAATLAGVPFTAALGTSTSNLEGLPYSYRSAKELLKNRFFYTAGELLTTDAACFGEDAQEAETAGYDLNRYIDTIYYAVDIGNAKALKELTRAAAYAMIRSRYTEETMKNAFVELLAGVHSKLTQHHPELVPKTKEYTDRVAAIYRQRTAEALCGHAAQFLEELIWQAGRGGKDQEMKRVLDLIQRNYAENIKLETLASVFNYNSAYLGKMFKNVTGEYFNTYLDKVRIQHAKDFLKQGMKVYQVAEKVGYTNVDYFHSKFKKYVGTSPSIYRKEYEG